ncbi:alpha/beta fold hydrolase [Paenibacillus caui]|uniref:alpha/beta fold hydrolase n=1 Tax=Paenibacillus caui TaxID=2873927 RepID=UPI001CA83983|nr:alpha/beta hydrolase [Paenibacillus caui]
MERATVNGIKMAYEDQGAGEVIVLLHGFCGSSAYWDWILPILSKHYRCIAPDLRGHGSTDAPLGAYTIEQMADDVALLLDSLGIERCILLGHSMGGYVTLSLAQRYPSKLNGFGLIHSTAYPDSEEAKEKRLKAVAAVQSGISDFIDGLVPGLFSAENAASMTEAVNLARQIGYRTPPQGAAGASLAMRERVDRRDVLSTSPLPVLLVAGEQDNVVPIERTFTADGSNVTKSVIKGAGHMSMYEAPEQLAAVIEDFVRSIRVSE